MAGAVHNSNGYGYSDAGWGSISDAGIGAFYYNKSEGYTKIDIATSIYTNLAGQKQIQVTFNGITKTLDFSFCQDYDFGVGNECTFRIDGDPFGLSSKYSGAVTVKTVE